ncbi:MAG TPA: hypothetical protein VEM57_09345 [Candidatus Binatus sp.]|nr:hypothetical protein [Candidatus Binatus sp.]
MIPITAAIPPDSLVLSSLAALLAPLAIVAASALVLTFGVLVVGIVNEGRDSMRRRRMARASEAETGPGALRAA